MDRGDKDYIICNVAINSCEDTAERDKAEKNTIACNAAINTCERARVRGERTADDDTQRIETRGHAFVSSAAPVFFAALAERRSLHAIAV